MRRPACLINHKVNYMPIVKYSLKFSTFTCRIFCFFLFLLRTVCGTWLAWSQWKSIREWVSNQNIFLSNFQSSSVSNLAGKVIQLKINITVFRTFGQMQLSCSSLTVSISVIVHIHTVTYFNTFVKSLSKPCQHNLSFFYACVGRSRFVRIFTH